VTAVRSKWTSLTDEQLLAQCAVDTYRASGPGGQKRNKTSSAVRLRHFPSGLVVIAEESRSQHENRARALRRLRQALYLSIREPVADFAFRPDVTAALTTTGRLDVGRRDNRFWPAVGVVLDILNTHSGRVAAAAEALGITTGNLVDFLGTDVKVWQQVNEMRKRHGQKPLH
jgi:hypothetical protein